LDGLTQGYDLVFRTLDFFGFSSELGLGLGFSSDFWTLDFLVFLRILGPGFSLDFWTGFSLDVGLFKSRFV